MSKVRAAPHWTCEQFCWFRLSFTVASRRIFATDECFFQRHAAASCCLSCGKPPSPRHEATATRWLQDDKPGELGQTQGRVVRVNRRLHAAVLEGTLSLERSLRRCYVDAGDLRHRTALHVACCRGDLAAAEVLLSYGADPNARSQAGLTPLYFAMRAGCEHMVKRLLDAGAHVNEMVQDYGLGKRYGYLHYAVAADNYRLADVLLACGADPEASDCCGRTALQLAARLSRAKMVRLLLDHGAKPSSRALHAGVSRGDQRIVELLLGHGALPDFEAVRISLVCRDLNLLRLLLRRSSVPLLLDSGSADTALHCLQRYWYGSLRRANEYWRQDGRWAGNWPSQADFRVAAARLLLDSGLDVNASNARGETPLHLASREFNLSGDGRMLTMLLEHGADVGARDAAGRTAIQQAGLGCIERLLVYGANGAELLSSPLRAWCPHELDRPSPELEEFEERWIRLAERLCARYRTKLRLAGMAGGGEGRELRGKQAKRLARDCELELREMKTVWRYAEVSAYQLLVASKRRLARYSLQPDVCGFAVFLRRCAVAELPNYADLLGKNLAFLLRRSTVVREARSNLDVLCRHRLPDSILETILCYLEPQDMEKLKELT